MEAECYYRKFQVCLPYYMALQHTNPHIIWTLMTFYNKRPFVADGLKNCIKSLNQKVRIGVLPIQLLVCLTSPSYFSFLRHPQRHHLTPQGAQETQLVCSDRQQQARRMCIRHFRAHPRSRWALRSTEKFTQRILVIPRRRFGKTYRPHLQGSVIQVGPLKMGPIGFTETSVRNYQYTLRKFLRGDKV